MGKTPFSCGPLHKAGNLDPFPELFVDRSIPTNPITLPLSKADNTFFSPELTGEIFSDVETTRL